MARDKGRAAGGNGGARRKSPNCSHNAYYHSEVSHVNTPDGPLRIAWRARWAINRAVNSDFAFFRAHPGAMKRVRPIIPGEEWPVTLEGETHVLVIRIDARNNARCFQVGAE
jgi:hypothetical protein